MSGTGPSSNTTINSGAGATLTVAIAPALGTVEHVGVMSIDGVPDGIVIGKMATSATAVTLYAFNPTGSNITVSANAVSVKALVVGY